MGQKPAKGAKDGKVNKLKKHGTRAGAIAKHSKKKKKPVQKGSKAKAAQNRRRGSVQNGSGLNASTSRVGPWARAKFRIMSFYERTLTEEHVEMYDQRMGLNGLAIALYQHIKNSHGGKDLTEEQFVQFAEERARSSPQQLSKWVFGALSHAVQGSGKTLSADQLAQFFSDYGSEEIHESDLGAFFASATGKKKGTIGATQFASMVTGAGSSDITVLGNTILPADPPALEKPAWLEDTALLEGEIDESDSDRDSDSDSDSDTSDESDSDGDQDTKEQRICCGEGVGGKVVGCGFFSESAAHAGR